jgi:16S rRNA (cytidine1402-2'-O)-methyltransferase
MSGERSEASLFLIPNLLSAEMDIEAALSASALNLLRSLGHFVVESEKTAWRLLSKARGPGGCGGLSLEILDEHSREEDLPQLLKPLEEGFDLGLVSEAGMPCVADPGAAPPRSSSPWPPRDSTARASPSSATCPRTRPRGGEP